MKWLWVAGVVAATAGADLLQSAAMKGPAGARRWRLLAVSVFFMAASFVSFLRLLEVAEFSFAVPATAASLALETVLAKTVLGEEVGWRRWTGAACVAAGVVLVGR